jgi:DNA-binding MarR family transcriptional regulator
MANKPPRVNSATPKHALLNELRNRALDYQEFKDMAALVTRGCRTKSIVTQLISDLVEQGFIEITVCVTPEGRDVAVKADQRMSKDMTRVLLAQIRNGAQAA